ncbi:MAG: YfiR family protein [Thermodesulfobacteriota bacterium]|nr:YfiR family protein [Thermodesulfobacteriota bacterium]
MINKAVALTIIAAVLMVAGFAPAVQGEDKVPSEYVLKAAFLFNFAKFVEWPAEALTDDQRVISLCVFGEDPFGGALESIEGKTVKGRKVMTSRSKSLADLKECHILFISRSMEKDMAWILAELRDLSVLTVGDTENFTHRGGIINFVTVGNKLRFDINMKAARENGLKISSKLLKLANKVSHWAGR